MTEVGSIIGTAQYLSPEQARGSPVDQTSDLYSVGVVLYELLTGQGSVHRRLARRDRDEAHLGDAEPPSTLRPEIPPSSTRSCCARSPKSPQQRYKSAEEMDRDLARRAGRERLARDGGGRDADHDAADDGGRTPPPQPREVFYEYEEPRRGGRSGHGCSCCCC